MELPNMGIRSPYTPYSIYLKGTVKVSEFGPRFEGLVLTANLHSRTHQDLVAVFGAGDGLVGRKDYLPSGCTSGIRALGFRARGYGIIRRMLGFKGRDFGFGVEGR